MSRRAVQVLVLVAWVMGGVLSLPAFAQPETGQMSLPQVRVLALQAAQAQDWATADALSSALLRDNPDDADALLVRALVARAAGDLDASAAAGRRSYELSTNPALKFEAAILVADVLNRQEKYTRSQIWLRRADQTAVRPEQKQLAANAYRSVSARNPLAVQLRFGARPTNNANNGAETTIIEIGGLPFVLDPSGQQLGGFEVSGGLSFSYRLDQGQRHRRDLVGELSARKIWLDSEAATLAPGVRSSDFDYAAAIVGVRERRLIWDDLGPTDITGLFGQSWYGGDALARWGELRLGQSVRRNDTSAFNFGTVLRSEKRLDDDINSSHALSLSAGYAGRLENGGFSVSATFKNVWSDSGTVDLFSTTLSARRAFDTIGSVRPTLHGSVEQRIYHKFATAPGGREDVSASIGLDVTWPGISYYGFSPQLELRARRTFSNVDIYDRNEYSAGLTAVSRF
ncbi:MAG: hypothetical protein OXQ92_00255 [Boseongicola sp.]|nr:hypothetical protein [Boseongicola sp.]